MSKNSKKSKQEEPKSKATPLDNSFCNLMDSYTAALEYNSALISAMLQELSTRELSKEDKRSIELIGEGLSKIDKGINKLGR